MSRKRVIATALVVAAVGALAALAVAAGPESRPAEALGNTLYVPSQFPTIQAAIDAAPNGGKTIIVAPGTYEESVVIQKPGMTIRGAPKPGNPVILEPPAAEKGCVDVTGEVDGICIAPPDAFPLPTLSGIEISGLTIRNFPGSGIDTFSVSGLNVHDNTLVNNGVYGIARIASQHTQIVGNSISGSTDPGNPSSAGIYVADSPNATALVRRNTVTNFQFGIYLRDSTHGNVPENTVTGNCVGILLIDTAQPGETFDWTIVHNRSDNNTKGCPGDDAGSSMAVGISVLGARSARLTANHATGNVGSGLSIFGSGGIVVTSAAAFGGPAPSNVQVDHNTLVNNSPSTDLSWDSTGKNVKFGANSCASSSPAGLC